MARRSGCFVRRWQQRGRLCLRLPTRPSCVTAGVSGGGGGCVLFEVAGGVRLVVEADGGGGVGGRGALEQEAAGGVDAAAGYVGVGAQAVLAGEAAYQVRDGAVQGVGGLGQADL